MLETSIDRLAAAIELLAGAISSSATAKPAAAVAQEAKPAPAKPAPAKPAPAKPTTGAATAEPLGKELGEPLSGPTVEQLRDQLRALLDAKGKDAVVAALGAVGAAKLSDVKQADFTRLAKAITDQSAAQADPFA